MRAIVVGTDGSATASEAVSQAARLAQTAGARLHIVNAYRPASADAAPAFGMVAMPFDTAQLNKELRAESETVLDRAVSQIETGVESEIHARAGTAADVILDVAEELDADLIVVGNKGMTGTRRFLLGSVPNRVAHHASCNVLIVRTC